MLTFPVLWGVEVGEEKASISFPTDTSGGSVDLAVECLGQYKPSQARWWHLFRKAHKPGLLFQRSPGRVYGVTQGCFLDTIRFWELGKEPSTCTWLVLVPPAVWALGDWLKPLPAFPPDLHRREAGTHAWWSFLLSCWSAGCLLSCHIQVSSCLTDPSAQPYL